jgi:ectoine hydroxylase-related dioxygenase (phytanoyl-CoA dioxygenase family)
MDIDLSRGYFKGQDDGLLPLATSAGEGVKQLVQHGFLPVFIYLFDEAWNCYTELHRTISGILGDGYKLLPNFWAWHIGPGQSGWKPHRDRGRISLSKEGSPKSITVWIPLTVANVDNSCVHVMPIEHDPTYRTDREGVYEIDVSKATALEAKPGEFLGWNQSVIHWGSAAGRCQNGPRISIAAEFQRGDVPPFETPLITLPVSMDFHERLRMILRQILQYAHMQDMPTELLSLAKSIYG